MSTLAQLDQAAKDVVGEMKKIKEYADAKVAVIGGLALWNYIKSGRTTKVCTRPSTSRAPVG